jgi:hypothetical protein
MQRTKAGALFDGLRPRGRARYHFSVEWTKRPIASIRTGEQLKKDDLRWIVNEWDGNFLAPNE